MRIWMAVVLPLTLLAAFASSCGGGGTKTFKGPDGQVVKVSDNKSLPDSFPKDFPIYDGAKYQGGIETSEQGVSGFYATWETGDSADKVSSFYTDKLKDGPWKTLSTVHSGDGSFIGVQRGDDEAQTGFVSIANDGKTTTIGIIVGKNLNGTPRAQATESGGGDTTDASPTESGSDSGSPSSGDSSLPDEVSLPKDYPKDRAPLPSGVRLTSASSITSGGQSLYTVEFYSKDDASTISQYFKDELPKHNWSQVLASESGGESLLSYSDGDNQSVTITIGQADVAGYQKVSMLLTVKAST